MIKEVLRWERIDGFHDEYVSIMRLIFGLDTYILADTFTNQEAFRHHY